MADEDEVEVRGIKRPLVENYSDDDEEEEARRKEGIANSHFEISEVLKRQNRVILLRVKFASHFPRVVLKLICLANNCSSLKECNQKLSL